MKKTFNIFLLLVCKIYFQNLLHFPKTSLYLHHQTGNLPPEKSKLLGVTLKKYCFFLFLLLFTARVGFGQNLVPNWSFEDTVFCPTGPDQMNGAVGWSSFSQSPEYFNSCNNGSVGIPYNTFGNQNALHGNAYGGFITSIGGQNYREFIGSQLVQPLDSGIKYFVSFYVSRGSNLGVQRASNKIGIKFSLDSYSNINPQPIDNNAQVFTDSIIEDTLNWVKIFGSFIADSGYQYLSIGNFFDDSLTSVVIFDTIVPGVAYYYLDCVCVAEDSLTCNSYVGINKHNSNLQIDIYPNPSQNIIFIESGVNDSFSFEFYNSVGELILRGYSKKNNITLDISKFSNGFYVLMVRQKENTFIKKIIKN
ncbi:MAG: T9SS type A sorting domain-containing protein [Bacteroidia bacterium]